MDTKNLTNISIVLNAAIANETASASYFGACETFTLNMTIPTIFFEKLDTYPAVTGIGIPNMFFKIISQHHEKLYKSEFIKPLTMNFDEHVEAFQNQLEIVVADNILRGLDKEKTTLTLIVKKFDSGACQIFVEMKSDSFVKPQLSFKLAEIYIGV